MTKIKILYVEDEPALGQIVKESLESREFIVHMVKDGRDAVNTFKREKSDICVLDIMLPFKDGFAIAKDIRLDNSLVPIIFVTAKNQTEDVIKGFVSGGNDYIRKPFSMEELIMRIHNLLKLTSHKSINTAETISIGKYEFIPVRYELRSDTFIKKLSHRESTLLQMLYENRNTKLLRRDILMKLWGDDSFFNSRNLDVYITKLRDYLKDDKSVQIITIKGIGYQFTVG